MRCSIVIFYVCHESWEYFVYLCPQLLKLWFTCAVHSQKFRWQITKTYIDALRTCAGCPDRLRPTQLMLKDRRRKETDDQACNLDDQVSTISDIFPSVARYILGLLPLRIRVSVFSCRPFLSPLLNILQACPRYEPPLPTAIYWTGYC